MTEHDYRVDVRVLNNRVWQALHNVCPGFRTVAECACRLKIPGWMLYQALTMKSDFRGRSKRGAARADQPVSKAGRLIAAALKSDPEYLFDANLYGPKFVARQVFEVNGVLPLQPYLPRESNVEVEVQRKLTHDHIETALKQLRPVHADVLKRRFGLDGPAWTLDEIARDMHLTQERIRQLESQALFRINKPKQIGADLHRQLSADYDAIE